MRQFIAALILLASASICWGQTYTNKQQNFSIDLPGAATDQSMPGAFLVNSYNDAHTVNVSVLAPNQKTSDMVSVMHGFANRISPGDVECRQLANWHGDTNGICVVTNYRIGSNHLHGSSWFCIHYGYLYQVTVMVSDGAGVDGWVDRAINSFAFLN